VLSFNQWGFFVASNLLFFPAKITAAPCVGEVGCHGGGDLVRLEEIHHLALRRASVQRGPKMVGCGE
jgi:hypothetical protein